MSLPKFTAEGSVYQSRGHYYQLYAGGAPPGAVVPAIPFCGNCDEILDRCAANGGRPRAVCRACAIGNCFSGVEDPTPNDPFTPTPGWW
jgi:hypothetical protein